MVALDPGVRDLSRVAMVMARPHLPSTLCWFWITSLWLEVQLCARMGHTQIILGVWAVAFICTTAPPTHTHTHTHTGVTPLG